MTRKPWLAAMLSLLMPGLGQIYSGALERGVLILCVWWATVVLIFAVTIVAPAWIGAWLPYPLLIASLVIVMADAVRTARGAALPFVPESYNRWYVYLMLPLFFAPALGIPIRDLIKFYLYDDFKIPIGSMAPTILAGDYIYATRWHGPINRGVNVIFKHDGNRFVKRVVGIAGDTLAMRNDSLSVNHRYVPEPYAIPAGETDGSPNRSTWGPIIVPPRMCFVLGDNRGNSLDSRFFGFVSTDSVVKRAIGVYFSRNPETHAIRWSRIGRDISR